MARQTGRQTNVRAPQPPAYGSGIDRHSGHLARERGLADSSRLVKHVSKMPAEPMPHATKLMNVLDVDWRTIHSGEKEWLVRDNTRKCNRLANYHGIAADGASKPWSSLRESQATPGAAGSRSNPITGEVEMRSAAAVGPQMGSLKSVELPPATASSRGISTASGPPGTSSTTLSNLWRRAMSTPALPMAGDRDITSSKSWREKGLPTENWVTAELADGLDQDELGRLIEHVHNKIVRERKRRKDVQEELTAIKEDKAVRSSAIAKRQLTPAVLGSS